MKLLLVTLFFTIFGTTNVWSLELSSCEKYWRGLDHEYDFSKHAQFTYDGNWGYQEYADPLARENCLKENTILIYMAADNDLTPYALWDMSEMERIVPGEYNLGTSTLKTDVIVELDSFYRTGIRRYHVFAAPAPYLAHTALDDFLGVSETTLFSPIVARFPEDDSYATDTQKNRLKNFLTWAVEKYPSKKYTVVFWGHGRGYEGVPQHFQLNQQDFDLQNDSLYLTKADLELPQIVQQNAMRSSLLWDQSEKDGVTIPEVKEVLSEVREEQAIQSWDALIFDACLMQTLEVVTSLKEETEYLMGSVQVQNYLGLPYRSYIDQLGKGLSTYQLAKKLPSLVEKSYLPGGYQSEGEEQRYETMTFSSVNTKELAAYLIPSLIELSNALREYLKEDPSRAMELRFLLDNTISFGPQFRDLGLFLGTLKKLLQKEKEVIGYSVTSENLKMKINSTWEALNRSIIDYRYGPRYNTPIEKLESDPLLGFFRGLSLWIPNSREAFFSRYEEMKMSPLFQYKNDHGETWGTWMEQLYSY